MEQTVQVDENISSVKYGTQLSGGEGGWWTKNYIEPCWSEPNMERQNGSAVVVLQSGELIPPLVK